MKHSFISIIALGITVLTFHSECFAAHPDETLLHQYKELLKKFPPHEHYSGSCKVPDILGNKGTRHYRTSLRMKLEDKPAHVNFCGKYYLFNEPITGGGDIYLSDCKNGKIITLTEEYASNQPLIDSASCLLIELAPSEEETKDNYIETAYGPPRLYKFNGKKLIPIKDTIWPAK